MKINLSYKDFIKNSEDVESLYKIANEKITLCIDKILNNSNNFSYEENFGVLADELYNFEVIKNILFFYLTVGTKSDVKNYVQEKLKSLNNYFASKISLNSDLYKKLIKTKNSINLENLQKEDLKFIEDILKEYKRSGIDLPENKLNDLKKIKSKILEDCLTFEQNIQNDSLKGFYVEESFLEGISNEQKSNLKKNEKNEYFLSVDYPTYNLILKYCKNRSIRKRLYDLFKNRGYPKNIEILKSLIEKRKELSDILEYKNYTEYDVENSMAEKVENITSLLDNLQKSKLSAAIYEKNELQNLANSIFDEREKEIKPWDTLFLLNIYKKNNFEINEVDIEKYLELSNVIEKMFYIFKTFFNIKINKISISNEHLYSKDSEVYRVTNLNNEIIGDIIFDLFPRENKYSHACNATIIPAIKNHSAIPITAIVCNFRKNSENISYLSINELSTLFHEFGHAMHCLFGSTKYVIHSGTNTLIDFVEIPSQLFEQWLKDDNLMMLVSEKNEKKMPLNLIEKIKKSEDFGEGLFYQRQIYLSRFSLFLFLKEEDSRKIKRDAFNSVNFPYSFDEESFDECNFGHLTEYGAKYYSYRWSLIYSEKIYEYISKNGNLNSKIGMDLVDKVLSKGGSEDYKSIIKNFIKEDININ